MKADLNRILGKRNVVFPNAGIPAPVTRKPQGNRRIMRARGFQRAWLIADHLKRFDDGAGIILKEALTHLWLSEQRRWA